MSFDIYLNRAQKKRLTKLKIRNLYPEDAELVRTAQKHNRRAQETLYNKYAPKMLSVCRMYVRDVHFAEDVLMRGFLKAFTHLKQFGKTANFEGWLRKIMINEALTFLRSKKQLVFLEEQSFQVPEESTPEVDFSMEEIQYCIDQLPETQRVVFNLFAIEGYSHREVAALVHIPVGTSKVYLSRARVTLQQFIKTHYLKKMKKHKLESQFKEKLALRRMHPSPEVWEQIDTALQAKEKRGRLVFWYSLTAMVLVLLGLSLYFENSSFTTLPNTELPVVKEEKPNKIIPTAPTSIDNPSREALRPVSVAFNPQNTTINAFDLTPTVASLTQLTPLPMPLAAKDESIRDSLLQLETEALLEMAYKNIQIARDKKARQRLNALELLIAVEEELYSEIQLKTRIIDFIRDGYTKVSMNSNEINP